MAFDSEIIVVSGLPRSGTSLMMQMLDHAGIKTVTDGLREPDVDNPRGYYEYEKVKTIKQDASWLPETRTMAFKMVSQLLYDLPLTERYRIIFMERDLDEVLTSQSVMLERRNRHSAEREQMKQSFAVHLERLHEWLREQPCMQVLRVNYNRLIDDPEGESLHISKFLGGRADATRMAQAIRPDLYRNRNRAQS